jgi:hypothetical protein
MEFLIVSDLREAAIEAELLAVIVTSPISTVSVK